MTRPRLKESALRLFPLAWPVFIGQIAVLAFSTVDTVMAAPGQITLVPIGPLTNIAQALSYEPRLAENLAGIVLMGGNAFVGGNGTVHVIVDVNGYYQ